MVDQEGVFKKPAAPKEKKTKYSIYELFNFAQREETDISKINKKMVELYETTPEKEFKSDLEKCTKFILDAQEKCKQVEKSLQCIVRFLGHLDKAQTKHVEGDDEEEEIVTHPLLRHMFEFLFKISTVDDSLVRFRVCHLTSLLLYSVADIDDDIFANLTDIMLARLKDKMANIRVQAVLVLSRLQDRENKNCPVKEALKFHLANDPSADVRKTVVRHIQVCHETIATIMGRLDDTSDKVRKHVYWSIGRQNVSYFSMQQRQIFVEKGLRDRSKVVKTAAETVLLPLWFQRFDHDYIKFLNCFNVEQFEEPALQSLEILAKNDDKRIFVDQFESLLNDQYLIPTDNLNPNHALFWRFVTTFFDKEERDSNDEETLDESAKKLPLITPFSKYIRAYFLDQRHNADEVWKVVQMNFNLIQLLTIAMLYDYKDEDGRIHMQQLCIDLLKSSHVDTIELITVIVQLLAIVVRSDDTKLTLIADIIAELRDPSLVETTATPRRKEFVLTSPRIGKKPFRSIQQARLMLDLNIQEEALQTAIEDKDFELAEEMCKKVADLKAKLGALGIDYEPTSSSKKAPPVVEPEVEDEPMIVPEKRAPTDPLIIQKCLRILIQTLQVLKIDHLTPTLRSLTENLVIPSMLGMDHEEGTALVEPNDPNVLLALRKDAVEALGLLCILDENLAIERMAVFHVLMTNPAVQDVAIKTIFDLLCKYGLEVFKVNPLKDDVSKNRKRMRNSILNGSNQFNATNMTDGENFLVTYLMDHLVMMLDTDQRNLILLGLCKLMFIGRIKSADLLSKLIVFWFSRESSADLYVQQQLGNFFSKFASICPQAPDMIRDATLPTIEAFASAPPDSPLGEVDVDNALKLLIRLTCQQKCAPPRPHDVLARDILVSIIDKKNIIHELTLIKSLHKLEISYNNAEITEELLALTKTAERALKEKLSVQKMKVFRLYLENETSNNQKSTLINTRHTIDPDTRNTIGSRSSSMGLSSQQSRSSSQGGTLDNVTEDDNDAGSTYDEASEQKQDELHRRLSLLNLPPGVVQGSSDEEDEDGTRSSVAARRPIIPDTPDNSDNEDSMSSTSSDYMRPKRSKRTHRRF